MLPNWFITAGLQKGKSVLKRIIPKILAFMSFLLSPFPVFASQNDPPIGQISVQVEQPDIDVEGIEFRLVQCGSLENETWAYPQWTISSGADLKDLDTGEKTEKAALALEQYLVTKPVSDEQQTVTDAQGRASFEIGREGLYLVYAAKEADREKIMPSLVQIPYVDLSSGNSTFSVLLHVKAKPQTPQTPSSPGTNPTPSQPAIKPQISHRVPTGVRASLMTLIILLMVCLPILLLLITKKRRR